ncbi:host attachment protein [Phenylobacterium sp. LjRoot164]|uniref:host attachment protein n=1 Tax=unclassified Phenylobacterium TaxID=2640670 RepID=UPI003ECF8370
MKPSMQLLFVLTDGGRARFVRKSDTTGHFETIDELKGLRDLDSVRERVRSRTLARTQSSATPRRSAIRREDTVRAAKETFLDRVAERAAATCRREHLSGIFIAAPARLIGPFEARLRDKASLAGTLGKDLTKTPIERLDQWIGDIHAARLSPR